MDRKNTYECVQCGDYVTIDPKKIKCKHCLDLEVRALLKKKLGKKVDPQQLMKALGIDGNR